MTKRLFPYIIFSLLLSAGVLIAQENAVSTLKNNAQIARQKLLQDQQAQRDQQLFHQAQTLINMNRYNNAIPLLEDLVSRNLQNISYYDWLFRAYLITASLSPADSLVSVMQRLHPDNVRYDIDRANILYRLNKQDEAQKLWNRIIQQNPTNISLYSQVANAMLENNLPDEAIRVYRKAMENIPNSRNLNLNIANIYKNRLMYVEATQYFLEYLSGHPDQQAYIFNQILALQIEPDQLEEFFQTLENMARRDSSSPVVKLLLAQLYQRYRNFDRAFVIYKSLEDNKSDGLRLISFARAAEQDSSYVVALESYRFVMNQYPESPHLVTAYGGAVSTLFQLARLQSRQDLAEQAFALIDTVTVRFPQSPELIRLQYLKGLFYLDYYFDVDKAISLFSDLIRNDRITLPLQHEILLKTGECLMIRGDLDKARETFHKIRQLPYVGSAQLYTALCYYFQGNWENSLHLLQTMVQTHGSSDEVINDVLVLQFKITQLQEHPPLLVLLSHTEFLVFQRKKSEAVKKYGQIIGKRGVPPAIKSEAYIQLVELSLDLSEDVAALEYSTLAVKDPEVYLYGDRHLLLMGTVLQYHVDQPREAFNVYRQLLENYPRSLLADQARDRLKILRQQKTPDIP